MKNRCLNPSAKRADYFGLEVHQPWIDSFATFLKDMGPKPTAAHTLDRVDNTRGYLPGNCRWATKQEQACNRRTNVYAGQSIEQAAAMAGVHPQTVKSRLARGYSPDVALSPKGTVIRLGNNGDGTRGEKNINAKLTADKVRAILLSDGRSTALAAQYGVSKTTINLIRSRKVWSHINV